MSSRSVRHRVAEQLEHLNASGQRLAVDSARSTWRLHGDSVARLRVWESVIEEYLAAETHPVSGQHVVLVTAGPPGAGKSTAIDALGDRVAHWRRIDPDQVKRLLITRELRAGTYEAVLREELADGRPIQPMELSGLVHEESIRIASEIRRRCYQAGENLIIEGTLAWEPLIDVYLQDFARWGYDALEILSLDLPIDVALNRALDRWWIDRSDPSNYLGGRFVPRATIAASYRDDGHTLGSVHAAEMERRAARLGLYVEHTALIGTGEGADRARPAAINETQPRVARPRGADRTNPD